MRKSREKYIFPLQVGVPYRTLNDTRVVFESIEEMTIDLGYDRATGKNGYEHHDITEFYIEEAVWLTAGIGEVLVTLREERSTIYPFNTYEMRTENKRFQQGLSTLDGYEYQEFPDESSAPQDIIGFVRSMPKQEVENFAWFRQRINNGDYILIHDKFPIAWNTGAHLSTTEPDLLAYFPTQKHWDNRVPQKIKAGRYLKKYFPDMNDNEVREKANLLTGGHRTLKVLTHWYDMFVAYRTLDVNNIVSSCMTKDCWRPVHPLMVYHESDVQLVVMYECDEPKARALVNKNTKEFNIIYGQWERMLPMLEKEGYTHGSLDGATINKLQRYPSGVSWDDLKESIEAIRTTDMSNLLMPYIDGHRDHSRGCNNATSVNVHSDSVEIQKDGDFTANDYENALIGEREEETEWCELCEENFPYGEGYYLEHEGIDCCTNCYYNHTVRAITHVSAARGKSWELVTEYYARDNCIYVDETTEWYMSTNVAEQAGWVYSDYHNCWMDREECVCMEDGEWISADEEGIVFEFDEAQGEYVYIPKDTKTLDIVDHTTALAT